ncbi:preprotein translocase subunit SecA [Patescibacteria group bacterium]|nr:preprotein translocase subunit SecA [Patescibacteria group bacterium]
MRNILTRLFAGNEKQTNQLKPIVQQINALENSIKALSDDDLKGKQQEFRSRLQQGETLDQILPQAYAVVREVAQRTIGERAYDVQLMAGIVLHQGKVAEQKTGEGKTLSATMPLYLNALTGKGAHLVTVNDYLSRRDIEWMGPIYHNLGLTTACLNHEQAYLYDPSGEGEEITPSKQESMESAEEENLLGKGSFLRPITRQEAYQADITYGTNNEFGFDYLRDNMVRSLDQMVQTCANGDWGMHHFAIVDEVDFLLIDQSRTPLIISAPVQESNELYQKFAGLVPKLPAEYYEIDEKQKTVHLTELGVAKIEKMLNVANLYQDFSLAHHLEQAIKAYKLFQKDRDYIIKEGQVIIVDEFTGRLMPGRRYSEGLHQAIEAKENVAIQKESKTLATITFQNFFRLYEKLSGMSATAMTEAEEFNKIYNLDIVTIPTNRPVIRNDHPDQIYKHQRIKLSAIVNEVEQCQQKGQPVLIGTTSVEKNELVSKLLKRRGITHQLLNAKNHQREAEIIAQAGHKGAVTVATNLAGRGTDIKLEPGVKELGGLHVIGTERHEARRIDNQLRGRSGRQGDPGSSVFYIALDDDLMRIFGGERIARVMERFNFEENTLIEHPLLSKQIESAQKRVEGYNFDIRKHLVEYDDVISRQREIIYKLRRDIIEQESLKSRILEIIGNPPQPTASPPQYEAPVSHTGSSDYEKKEKELGEGTMRKIEQAVYLATLDQLWMDHIDALDELRRGIQLRTLAQKTPLVEFKNEAFAMFKQLMDRLDTEAIDRILRVELAPQPQPQIRLKNLQARHEAFNLPVQPSPSSQPAQTSTRTQEPYHKPQTAKVGRNDPCQCGATRPDGTPVKYKHCHGKSA